MLCSKHLCCIFLFFLNRQLESLDKELKEMQDTKMSLEQKVHIFILYILHNKLKHELKVFKVVVMLLFECQ